MSLASEPVSATAIVCSPAAAAEPHDMTFDELLAAGDDDCCAAHCDIVPVLM